MGETVNDPEIIEPDLTPSEARSLTDNIRQALHDVWPLFVRAYRGRAWLALGYASWEAYCDTEMAGVRPSIATREQRREVVGDLRQAGMSTTAIASAVGISPATAWRDVQASSDEEAAPPATVQGADGKTYPATRTPEPQPAPVPVDPWQGWTTDELAMRDAVMHGETVVASLRGLHTRLIGWAEREGKYVRVDRRTQYGNPFEMPADGTREQVIANYAVHYLPFKPSITAKSGDLLGKVLGCWCAPEPCHADVLRLAAEAGSATDPAHDSWADAWERWCADAGDDAR